MNEAAKWAGTQYCWGGGDQNGPTHGGPDPTDGGYECPAGTFGFDCTGLTLYAVYQATGGAVLLSHGPGQAESDPSAPRQKITNQAELQPGDIVYFGGTFSHMEHAGVYAGVVNGHPSFWSAVTEGIGVALETMAWEETAKPFVGAIRFPGGGGSQGTWESAFQSNGNELWVVGTADNRGRMRLGMAPGTSPSITSVGGGWETAFQSSGNELWVIGTADDRGSLHLGMAPGTSPSITSVGGGWEAAFQANDGSLWVIGTADDRGSLHLGMAPGTSPSITSVGGGWETAFQSSGNEL